MTGPTGKRLIAAAAFVVLVTAAPSIPAAAQSQATADDRPYDSKLIRLTEILGAVHYLRALCGAEEGQLWRDQMRELLRSEGTTAIRRAKLVRGFNQGYRGFSRTYRSCTDSAKLAIDRFMEEGARLAELLVRENR